MTQEPTILVTGRAWIGLGLRTIDSVVEELLSQASRDVVMTVYVLTDVDRFVDRIKSLAHRGCQGRLKSGSPANVVKVHKKAGRKETHTPSRKG